MITLQISERDEGARLHRFLERQLPLAGSGFLYKMLRKKNITLNGKKADGKELLQAGDSVTLFFSDDTYQSFRGNAADFDLHFSSHPVKPEQIVYEDEHILIAFKPAGVLSQKDTADGESFNEMLLQYLADTGKLTPESLLSYKPGVCNRLDRNTSGLVLLGKTAAGGRELNRLLRDRSVGKFYYAVSIGRMTDTVDSRLYLTKDEDNNRVTVSEEPASGASVPIHTEIVPVRVSNDLSLLRIRLHTGKSHQIRSVLSYLKHPVLADPKYTLTEDDSAHLNNKYRIRYHLKGQMLLAYALCFPDNLSGAVASLSGKTVNAPVPESMASVIASELTKGEDIHAVLQIPRP